MFFDNECKVVNDPYREQGELPGRPIAQDVRTAVAQVEAGVSVVFMQPFEEAAAIGLLPQRLAAWVAGSVGSVGIFLAALGLHGLMAFLVAQRRAPAHP